MKIKYLIFFELINCFTVFRKVDSSNWERKYFSYGFCPMNKWSIKVIHRLLNKFHRLWIIVVVIFGGSLSKTTNCTICSGFSMERGSSAKYKRSNMLLDFCTWMGSARSNASIKLPVYNCRHKSGTWSIRFYFID